MQLKFFPIIACFLIFFFTLTSPCFALNASERKKVDYLLAKVEESNLVFIRNGKSYDGKNAREHLETKLRFVGNRIKTAEQFIDYVASKSSMTDEPYLVQLPDGTKVKSHDWLEQTLAQMPADQQSN